MPRVGSNAQTSYGRDMGRGTAVWALLSVFVVWQPACGTPQRVDLAPAKISVASTDFALELVADGFATPLSGTSAPGNDDQLFIVDQIGTITALDVKPAGDDGASDRAVFLDVGAAGLDLLVPLPLDDGFDERGLLGLAFDPGYAGNGLLYTYTSEPLGPTPDFTTLDDADERDEDASLSVIREWRVEQPALGGTVNPESSRVLLRIEQPQQNHNGGSIVFGTDSMLYIALGDGGSRDDQGAGHAAVGNGQDLNPGNLLGKILRIDPHGDNGINGQYGVPGDNPFVNEPGAAEIFAYGFRNPFRISFDRDTGDLFAGDVGQRDIEEVDVVVSGGNYGWPVKEGTFLFDANGRAPGSATTNSPGVPAEMIDPVAQYDHDEGTSIIGGFVYRGDELTDLVGTYVFGDLTLDSDFPLGRLFSLEPDGLLREIIPVNNSETRMYITGFGQDADGELYVMGLRSSETAGTTGQVFRLVPTR